MIENSMPLTEHERDRYYAWRFTFGGLRSRVSEEDFATIYRMAVREVLLASGKLSPQIELMRKYIELIDR